MNLSISNIAWFEEQDKEVYNVLKANGINHIEVAPTRIFKDWVISKKILKEFKQSLSDASIQVSSFQAILYGVSENIFNSSQHRKKLLEHLSKVLDLASELGASKLVFGSPKNRSKGNIDAEDAMKIACDFFRHLADLAANQNKTICLEPNAPVYSCDFCTNSEEAYELISMVNHENFKLHLDAACMHLADDSPENILNFADALSHYHISQPSLGDFKDPLKIHKQNSSCLQKANYSNLLAIEMRPGNSADENMSRIHRAIEVSKLCYGASS